MTITSSLWFLYILGGSGLLCGAPHYYLPPQILRLCNMPEHVKPLQLKTCQILINIFISVPLTEVIGVLSSPFTV